MSPLDSPPISAFAFDNTYARELEGLYVPWKATEAPQPALVKLNRELAEELGLDAKALDSTAGALLFSGNRLPPGAATIAQAYAGHQFGGFVPQLGDGRALLLGEVIDRHGRRRDIAFKGSGRTPFSRGGDGKAALGPVLREYLIGEAMHALGIPTTRALAAVTTGEVVLRERNLPGAVLTRVAASHIRVGTFQFVTAHGDEALLRRLADYVIKRHYPELDGKDDRYLGLLQAVTERQAALIARWMLVGFHPRRDEHRQHDALRRNHRLRPLRVHGSLRPDDGLQLDRRTRTLRLCESAADRHLEPDAAGGDPAAAAGRGSGSRGGAGDGSAEHFPGKVSAPLAAGHAAKAGTDARGGR